MFERKTNEGEKDKLKKSDFLHQVKRMANNISTSCSSLSVFSLSFFTIANRSLSLRITKHQILTYGPAIFKIYLNIFHSYEHL